MVCMFVLVCEHV